MKGEMPRLVARVLLCAGLFYLLAATVSAVFDHSFNWRAYQDPHERLLWDSRTDLSDVVLLGDSAFISAYVDRPEDALGNVLQRASGKRVFNGSLNGADAADFLNATKLLLKDRARDKTVVLDIVPTRFLPFRHPELANGNYPGEFGRLVGADAITKTLVRLRRPLVILDPDIMMNCIFPQRKWYGIEPRRDRVWNRDGDLARKRFETFEKELLDMDELGRMDWIGQMDGVLKSGDNRLVIFITPVNDLLIREYASPQEAVKIRARIARSREVLLGYLNRHAIPYIDGTGQFDSERFVDLIHPNARGDHRIAELITNYLERQQNQVAEQR